ncbi:MAG: hypothetical protein IPJ14_04625 [Kineosporiaceae bacterium]|nr:hypothetical protein [Kineosporiaceae bacterium]MBK7621943.1 hypothetical protein [Kineosporiaceae bacterium]MBK8074257.1 hypothetical protein [Kineosporiaceae bacterium]
MKPLSVADPAPRTVTPSLTRWFVIVVALTLVVVVGGTLLGSALRPNLPVEVASHYGMNGVDHTQPLTGYLVTAGVILVVLTLVLGALAAVLPGDGRRVLGVTHAWVVGLAATMMYGSLLGQRGLADAHQAPDPGPWLAAGVVVGTALAVLSWRLLRPARPAPPAHRDPLPDDAPRLPAGSTEPSAWRGPTPWATGAVVAVALGGVLAVVLAAVVDPWVAIIPTMATVGIVGMLRGQVSVDEAGVRVQSFGRMTWIDIPMDQVRSAAAEDLSPLRDFGGYGLRFRSHGRGFVTRSGPALRVDTYDGSATWVTVQDADQAAAVLNTLVARLES